MKTCNTCGQSKDFEDFHRQPGNRDGRENICKECRKPKDKAKSDRKSRLRNFW